MEDLNNPKSEIYKITLEKQILYIQKRMLKIKNRYFYKYFICSFIMENNITKEKLENYFELTSKALAKVKDNILSGKENYAKEIIDMVENYLSDAKHF